MKELYRFRQFLAEGVTADEITSRVRKLGKEKGIEDKYIEDYIDELDGNFEPDAYENSTDKDLLDDLKSYIDLSEGKLLKEDMTSKAVSVLKSYKGEVKGLEDYIKYLMNTSDDISSSIQAVADDMDRDNDAEDSLRRDLEKLSLAEGKLLKEDMSLEIDDDYIELSADSGEYSGDLNDDGTVDFSVVGYEEEREDGEIDFDDSTWESILGPKHAFVKISNKIPTKVEAAGDYVMITVDLEDLKNLIKPNKPKNIKNLGSYETVDSKGNIVKRYI